MKIRTQQIIVNTILGLLVIFGGMVAFWIYDANSQPQEREQVCRGWHGHKVNCKEPLK